MTGLLGLLALLGISAGLDAFSETTEQQKDYEKRYNEIRVTRKAALDSNPINLSMN